MIHQFSRKRGKARLLSHPIPWLCLILLSLCLMQGYAYAGQATLAWKAQTDNTGFKVHYGTASHSYTTVTDVGNTTAHQATNLVDGQTYYFALTAYSDGGESGYSSEATFKPTSGCTYTISPGSATTGAAGGPGSVAVKTPAGCSWTVTNPISWITISSGSSGTGNGTVAYSVAASDGTPRTGVFTIAGQAFLIAQTGGQSSSFVINAVATAGGSISPAGRVAVASGGSQSFTITPAEGHVVANVVVDGTPQGAITDYAFSNIKAGHTIAAQFAPVASGFYFLTVTKDGPGTIARKPGGRRFKAGKVVTLEAKRTPNSLFAGWSGACSGMDTTCQVTMNSNQTVGASFVRIHRIAAGHGVKGEVSPSGSVRVVDGGSQTFTITPDAGYTVEKVIVDGHPVGAVTSYTFTGVQKNHRIRAVFTK